MLGLSLREIKERKLNLPFLPVSEYLDESNKDVKEFSQEELWGIIQKGSMPRLYHDNADDNFWRQFYSDYIKTYIERDVRALTQVGDEIAFLQFMRLLAASTGQLLNYSRIANEIGKSVDTIKNWVSILRTSGVVFLLQPISQLTRGL